MHQVVGIYEWPDVVADHPDYLRALKDRIGLNLVILELNRSMALSPDVAARNPLPVGGERWGPGTRVPTLVISPFARRGFVDKTPYDTTSILKFITRRFGLEPLPGVREKMGDLTNVLER